MRGLNQGSTPRGEAEPPKPDQSHYQQHLAQYGHWVEPRPVGGSWVCHEGGPYAYISLRVQERGSGQTGHYVTHKMRTNPGDEQRSSPDGQGGISVDGQLGMLPETSRE